MTAWIIGMLSSHSSIAAIMGALAYVWMSRRTAQKRVLQFAIGIEVTSTLAHLLHRYVLSAILIDVTFRGIGMPCTLALLALAAKACPKQTEGMVCALLMSLDKGGVQGSQICD